MKQWELSGVTVDLSDRALSADALREAEERLRVLIQRIPAVIWTVDRDLRFTSSLGSALAHLGLKPNEVVGQTLYQFFRTRDPQYRAIAAHLQALDGEADSFELEWGGRIWHSHVEPFPDPDGLPAVIGVALDITERKEAEDRLRETGRPVPRPGRPHPGHHLRRGGRRVTVADLREPTGRGGPGLQHRRVEGGPGAAGRTDVP